jgi:hypothetical protein
MKKRWYVRYEMNGGEYHGYVYITAETLVRDLKRSDNVIICDDVQIEFDENIDSITEFEGVTE